MNEMHFDEDSLDSVMLDDIQTSGDGGKQKLSKDGQPFSPESALEAIQFAREVAVMLGFNIEL